MPPKKPTYDEAMHQLEAIISSIEEGKIGLEEIVEESEKGAKLLNHCRSILTEAEARIQKLQLGEEGQLTPEPMDAPPSADDDD